MEYRTLIDLYQSDAGLRKEFPDMLGKGISGEWNLNDWWNRHGKASYPNVELVQPGDPRISQKTEEVPRMEEGSKNTLTRFESDPTRDDISTSENTVWLYNKTSKTYTPIKNEESLKALLQSESIEEAFSHVNILPVSVLDSPEWQGNFGSFSNAIAEDGIPPETYSPVSGTEIDDNSLKTLYGQKQVSEEDEAYTGKFISFWMTEFKRAGYISEKVFNDNLMGGNLAKYINATLYGGYDLPRNIYADLRAKTLLEEGNQEYADFKAFDENISFEDWKNTEEGLKVSDDTKLTCPDDVINVDLDLFKNPIFEIPDAAFQTLVKPIDVDSPEFKAEAEEIQASYYDIMSQKAEAETEQAKAIADHNWEIFKKNLEKKHGLQLSDNAKTAWGQLQDLFQGSQQAGLSGSGLEKEVQDRYMKDVRDRDQLLRESKIDEEEMELRNKLLSSGSSEDIAAFIAENGEDKAKEWGLIPSDEMKQWFSVENLKKEYPDMTDDEINRIAGIVIDPETGNYKSQLYQNLYSNKYQLGEEKKTYQWEKLFAQKEQEEKEAYAQYTSRNPFLKLKDAVGEEFDEKDEGATETGETFTPDPTSDVPSSQQAMRDAVKNHTPIVTSPDPTSNISASQQAMRDAVKKHIPTTAPPVKQPTTQSGLDRIRSVFGSSWNPSESFKGATDYMGAVRVKGDDKVWGIGDNDPYHFSADSYAKRFGSAEQKGIVGEISRDQAKRLGISGY